MKSLGDYVQWCKANPDKANFGTTSAGGTPHFAGVMLSHEAKVPLNPVHYRGGAPALQDVVGGHIPTSVNPTSESMPLHQAGTIRILAVTGAKRSQFLPDVPTMAEQRLQRRHRLLARRIPARQGARRRVARVERGDA